MRHPDLLVNLHSDLIVQVVLSNPNDFRKKVAVLAGTVCVITLVVPPFVRFLCLSLALILLYKRHNFLTHSH